MQPELLEERGQSARHAPLPSGHRPADQRRRAATRHLREHVRAQQLQARQTHSTRGRLRLLARRLQRRQQRRR